MTPATALCFPVARVTGFHVSESATLLSTHLVLPLHMYPPVSPVPVWGLLITYISAKCLHDEIFKIL